MIPFISAYNDNPDIDLMPSFDDMFLRCVITVLGEIHRRSAISLTVSPDTSSLSTSVSLAVNSPFSSLPLFLFRIRSKTVRISVRSVSLPIVAKPEAECPVSRDIATTRLRRGRKKSRFLNNSSTEAIKHSNESSVPRISSRLTKLRACTPG